MIITDEKILRSPCSDAEESEVGHIVELLELELKNSARLGRPGVGLAAPQIGILKKVAIVRLGNNGYNDMSVNLINCNIEKGYDKKKFRDEGCLSYPGRIENTLRYQEIYVKNNLIFPKSFIATGLFAVVCQHELDHLNNILLPDVALPKNDKLIVKPGPNDKCYCNSGKKYKKCCSLKK